MNMENPCSYTATFKLKVAHYTKEKSASSKNNTVADSSVQK